MIRRYCQSLAQGARVGAAAWDRFWFTPASPRLLGIMRILTGAMLVYTHAVWSLELATFFSDDGVLPLDYARGLYPGAAGWWTHFEWVKSSAAMWFTHGIALLVMALFTVGLWTRVTAALSFLFLVSYAHRATGALFGLDQINGFLTLYLAIGPSGAAYSLDAWRRRRRSLPDATQPSTLANIAQRLIQVHLCVVYLFAGLSKCQGPSWWVGDALWGAFASADYQTIDLTGLAHAMGLVNLATLVALGWEISYPFLIWNRHARPYYLGLAVLVHLGIGLAMGMMTFGWIMIVANLAFLPSEITLFNGQPAARQSLAAT
jgi:hypothetical protein